MPRKLQVQYRIEPDAVALARRAAEFFTSVIAEAIASRGLARIAVSGGSTPKAVFALLADANQPFRAAIDWSRVQLFWVDERTVPPDHAESNYRMTREALLDHVPLAPEQIHRMEGELEPEAAAARYESAIRNLFRLEGAELPSFDLVALGMGDDAHTASLFPYTTAIHELGRIVVANEVPQKKTWRITLTWPTINNARNVFFLIGGAEKAASVDQVFQGPRDPERLPSQLIWPSNGILSVFLDKAAATMLPAVNEDGLGVLEKAR